jgi:hypothetical protein
LLEFKAHADATNDIFHVVARLVAGVLLRASAQLDAERALGPRHDVSPADRVAGLRPQGAAEPGGAYAVAGTDAHSEPDAPACGAATACKAAAADPSAGWSALQCAWQPYAVAWKAVWWEAIALPPDVTNEAAFRQGKRLLKPSQSCL